MRASTPYSVFGDSSLLPNLLTAFILGSPGVFSPRPWDTQGVVLGGMAPFPPESGSYVGLPPVGELQPLR